MLISRYFEILVNRLRLSPKVSKVSLCDSRVLDIVKEITHSDMNWL